MNLFLSNTNSPIYCTQTANLKPTSVTQGSNGDDDDNDVKRTGETLADVGPRGQKRSDRVGRFSVKRGAVAIPVTMPCLCPSRWTFNTLGNTRPLVGGMGW